MMLSGSAAISRMAPGTANLPSGCLYTVWVALGCPHTLGPLAGHTFATATEAYQYTTKRHTDRNPPPGVPVWFGSTAGPRYAGDKHWPDGDVALSVGGGFLYATDYPTWGHTGKCTIAQREAQTGRVYLGWTEDFLGNDVALAGAASLTEPPLMNADMRIIMALKDTLTIYRATDRGYLVVGPGFTREIVGNERLETLTKLLIPLEKVETIDTREWDVMAEFFRGNDTPAATYAVVSRKVNRDGIAVDQIEDNAATGTLVRELLARTGAVVPSGVSLTQEQVTQAVTAALATLTLKATS